MKAKSSKISSGALAATVSMTLVLPALAGGCAAKRNQVSNEDLYHQYDDNAYSEDIVSASANAKYGDADKGISARTLQNIEDTIDVTYKTDFEHCLEEEMDRLDSRWLAGEVTVEFDIGTDGTVVAVKVLSEDLRERKSAEGENLGDKGRVATGFDECLEAKAADWEFDPPPEVEYRHTYSLKLGEAW